MIPGVRARICNCYIPAPSRHRWKEHSKFKASLGHRGRPGLLLQRRLYKCAVCAELDHASKAAFSSWLYLPLLLHAQVCLLQPGTPLQARLPASQMAAMTSNSAFKSCRLKFRSPQLTKFYYCVYVGICLCVYRHIHAFTLNHLNKCRLRILLPTGMPVSSIKEL